MTKRRKAAIITPYGLFNYGNRLQNWAVDQALREHGYAPETLILRKSYLRPVLKDLALRFGHALGVKGSASRRYRRFAAFDAHIRKRRIWGRKHLRSVMQSYDLVVIGSDQIWNPFQVDFGGDEYATRAPGERVVALSASFGLDELPAERHETTRRLLSRMRAISVREVAGGKIVRDLTGQEANVLIDPTLSRPREEWEGKASRRLVPQTPYMLVYMLGNDAPEQAQAIAEFARSRSLEVIRIFDKSQPAVYGAGPDDFLGLIEGADVFLTDSYHGVIFSLIFETECFVTSRRGKSYSMTSRFDTLATKLSLAFSASDELPFARHVDVDGERYQRLVDRERNEFNAFAAQVSMREVSDS